MEGKDHIFISLMWGFLIVSPIILTEPVYFVSFLIGVILGSVLPDIDSPKSPYSKKGAVMQGTGVAVKYSSKLTGNLFKSLDHKNNDKEYDKHRGIMHSIPGILVTTLIITTPLNLILYAVGYWNIAFVIISIGLFAGALFHIFEDCCTCSGIRMLFPFSNKKLNGGINTFHREYHDNRPKQYGFTFMTLGLIFIVFDTVLRNTTIFAQYNFIQSLNVYELIVITTIIGFIAWYFMYKKSKYPHNCKS